MQITYEKYFVNHSFSGFKNANLCSYKYNQVECFDSLRLFFVAVEVKV